MIYFNLLIVFLVLVAIHEYGHYIVARFFKAEVSDFSIGFGKPLFKFTDKNGTTWKIAPIPLGGYVKIKGLDNIFSKNSSEDKGSFQSLTLFQKISVLLAGSVFNIVSAWLALFAIFFFFGIVNFLPIIGSVMENSAAYNNDLREGDRILEINNKNILDNIKIDYIMSPFQRGFTRLSSKSRNKSELDRIAKVKKKHNSKIVSVHDHSALRDYYEDILFTALPFKEERRIELLKRTNTDLIYMGWCADHKVFVDKKKKILGEEISKISKNKILYGPYTGTKIFHSYGWSNVDFCPKYLGSYE